ncbi:hypothetical protein TNIN_151591 [Trichonephila inaurata madagascariensis]|uniref:Uncharacterized protein n=1 Tax=Trichonephila inaurata madagascariensis TaxID=2747483 RepID=A0A8X6XST9_9ARAC|nr:hypothetical protein TNIN_151591 [Trichonephila inaurata madagascariensis]
MGPIGVARKEARAKEEEPPLVHIHPPPPQSRSSMAPALAKCSSIDLFLEILAVGDIYGYCQIISFTYGLSRYLPPEPTGSTYDRKLSSLLQRYRLYFIIFLSLKTSC